MRSIGFHLEPLISPGQLTFYYSRPTLQNLELHFIAIKKIINEIKPAVVILDPITNLMTEGPNSDIRSMLNEVCRLSKNQANNGYVYGGNNGGIDRTKPQR